MVRNAGFSFGIFALVAVGAAGCGGHGGNNKKSTAPASTAPPTSQTPVTPPPALALKPTIASLSTSTASLDGGVNLTITGKNFQATGAGSTFVLFGTSGVVAATPLSDTQIRVQVPKATTAGPVDVRVMNDLGAGNIANAFSYIARLPLVEFEPVVGHQELGLGGTKITLTLKNFVPLTPQATVKFGTVKASAVSAIDSQTLVAEVPTGTTPGSVEITVEQGTALVKNAGFLVQGPLIYGDLVVNEILCDPAGADVNRDGIADTSVDEFVEIVNTKAVPVDLSYLETWDTTSSGAMKQNHRFPNPTTLPPGGSIVIFGAGTPEGFAPRHKSGSVQQATSGQLGFNNNGESVEIRTLPGLSSATVIFKVTLTGNAPLGTSFTNLQDGRRIATNPATNADYEQHANKPTAGGRKFSPGKRADGTDF